MDVYLGEPSATERTMMLLWAAVGVILFVSPLAARQPLLDNGVALPCSMEVAEQPAAAVGVSRTVRPRVRKQFIANPPSAFDELKVDGRVVVSATVGTNGSLCDVRVVESSPAGVGLEEAGIASAKGWRFAPATRDGASVPAPVKIELTFSPWKEGRTPGARVRTANAEIEGADPLPPGGGQVRQPG